MKKSLLILTLAVMPILPQSPGQIAQDIKNLQAVSAGTYSRSFSDYFDQEFSLLDLEKGLEKAHKLGEAWVLPSPEEFKKGMETYTAVVDEKIPTQIRAQYLEKGKEQIIPLEEGYKALSELVVLLRSITPTDIKNSKEDLEKYNQLMKKNGFDVTNFEKEEEPSVSKLVGGLNDLIYSDDLKQAYLSSLGKKVFSGDNKYANSILDVLVKIPGFWVRSLTSIVMGGVVRGYNVKDIIDAIKKKLPTQAEISTVIPDDFNKIIAMAMVNKEFMSQNSIPKEFTGPNPAKALENAIEKNVAESRGIKEKYLKLFNSPIVQKVAALQDKLGGELVQKIKWDSITISEVLDGAIKDLKAKLPHSKL